MPGGYPLSLDICNGIDNGTVTGSSTGTAITSLVTPNTKGAYTQLVASTASDTVWVVIGITYTAGTQLNYFLLDIAVGAAASEKVIIPNLTFWTEPNFNGGYNYSFPIQIPAGTRISARCQDTVGLDTINVSILTFDGGFSQGEGIAGYDDLGTVASSSQGTSSASSGTNTKSSWTVITSSTAKDYVGLVIDFEFGNLAQHPTLNDIAIGGTGSEIIIISNLPNIAYFSSSGPVFLPILIPAGTQIQFRTQSTTSGFNIIGLHGAYQ